MKKKLSYRDKLLELAYIYNVKEIQEYTKRRKNLTTGQLELILKKNKIISKSVTQFKVLGNGELNSKLNIEADFSSKSAIQKVEKAGGSILVKSNKD